MVQYNTTKHFQIPLAKISTPFHIISIRLIWMTKSGLVKSPSFTSETLAKIIIRWSIYLHWQNDVNDVMLK